MKKVRKKCTGGIKRYVKITGEKNYGEKKYGKKSTKKKSTGTKVREN